MKKILLLLFTTLTVACTNTNKTEQNTSTSVKEEVPPVPKEEPYLLKVYLDKFIADNPDCLKNDILRKDCSDLLKNNFIKDNFKDSIDVISQLPLKFDMLLEYSEDKYVVKFEYGKYSSNHKLSDKYDVSFQIFSIVDKKTASELIDQKLYNISGTCDSFADKNSFTLPSGKYFEGYPTVSKNDNTLYIDLGTFIVKDLTFREALNNI